MTARIPRYILSVTANSQNAPAATREIAKSDLPETLKSLISITPSRFSPGRLPRGRTNPTRLDLPGEIRANGEFIFDDRPADIAHIRDTQLRRNVAVFDIHRGLWLDIDSDGWM